jgi:hypothetical protein
VCSSVGSLVLCLGNVGKGITAYDREVLWVERGTEIAFVFGWIYVTGKIKLNVHIMLCYPFCCAMRT